MYSTVLVKISCRLLCSYFNEKFRPRERRTENNGIKALLFSENIHQINKLQWVTNKMKRAFYFEYTGGDRTKTVLVCSRISLRRKSRFSFSWKSIESFIVSQLLSICLTIGYNRLEWISFLDNQITGIMGKRIRFHFALSSRTNRNHLVHHHEMVMNTSSPNNRRFREHLQILKRCCCS